MKSSQSSPSLWWSLILTFVPGILTLTGAPRMIGAAMLLSIFTSFAAGVVLGLRTGTTPAARVLHAIAWTFASLVLSLLFQAAGCAVIDFQPTFH